MKRVACYICCGILSTALLCACGERADRDSTDRGTRSSDTDDEKESGKEENDRTTDEREDDENGKTPDEPETSNSTSKEDDESGSPIASDPSDNELGWDGEWTGDGVTVTINGAGDDWTTVDIVDEEMHTSLDEVSIDGNTLTGVYRITLDMYPDPNEDLPEQEWTITMVKDGAHASYSRVAVLTWFSLNDDGTYGHEITKENSAMLTLVTNTSTVK